MGPRIVLIHGVTVAIPPIVDAFRADWPEAALEHLLDEGLVPALTREDGLTPRIAELEGQLLGYLARGEGRAYRPLLSAAVTGRRGPPGARGGS